MHPRLKPLRDQVIVITGASSGIGLVTARMAAAGGASVVLAARNATDLRRAAEQIQADGGRATYQVADVSDPDQVAAIAETALDAFGRIDTWVNNAAVSIYGRILDLPIEDLRRQFDVNYWGTVYGARVAVPYLQRQGGALINVASALADRAIPLQGNYCAAKHAMKAFTDSLRMELEEAGLPIVVSLVKPASIDTPFFQKAKTILDTEPQPVPPVYAPEICARAILTCAQRPVRDVVAGGMGRVIGLANLAPRFADRYMERTTFTSQMSDRPVASDRRDNLYAPVEQDGGERGVAPPGKVRERSLYTWISLHRGARIAAVTTLVVAISLIAWMA